MKSVSAQTRRPVLSRETIGRVIGGWPIWLHRAGLGRFAGRRYAVIRSVGRRTGRVRSAAVMVLREDPATGEVLVVAGTRDAHWFRNVCAAPATEVWLAGRRFRPIQRVLTSGEIADLLLAIRCDHPREARIQAAFFGWPWPGSKEDVVSLAGSLGGVSFAPAQRPGARDLAEASAPSAPSCASSPADRTQGTVSPAARLNWIDWLRVTAIAGVFLYHTLRPFDAGDWHVKNIETSELLGVFMMLFWSFGLAVLFLLAGAGTRFALRKRNWQTFLRERTLRLLVPFLAGTLLLSPVQGFIEASHKGTFTGSFPDYAGRWVGGLLDRPILSPTLFGVGYHLWFLGFLFAISVIALPLCEGLIGTTGRRAVDALARAMRWPGTTLAFAVPIALLMAMGAVLGTNEHDWFELLWYLGYFVTGFVLFSDERFTSAVRRDGWPAFAVAVSSTLLLVATPVGGLLASMADGNLDPPHLAVGILFGLEGWAWTLVILNVGIRAARLQRPVGDHLGEFVLPVYVIHQPVILAVAFFVVQWPAGILPKWIAIFGVSLLGTLALVELGLRAGYTRVLLGARARPPAPRFPASDRASVAERPSLPTASARHG